VWVTLGIFTLIEDDKMQWFNFGYIVLGVFYLGTYLYEYNYQYLTIDNGVLKSHALFERRKIKLNEIVCVKVFTDSYILKTAKKDFAIETKIIGPDSLMVLKEELERLDVKWI
jgi:hypothetical protein